jgi:hypothetical protein
VLATTRTTNARNLVTSSSSATRDGSEVDSEHAVPIIAEGGSSEEL